MVFVVVSGQPGAGKTTVARPLAARLGLPLLSKDTVKEALAVLDDPQTITVDRSRRLGSAAFDVVFALAGDSSGAVLEASWNPSLATTRLARLPGRLIEVHCACPPEVARSRYEERAGRRHWVHLDGERIGDDRLWPPGSGPHGLCEAPIVVDTMRGVDLDELVGAVVVHPNWPARSHRR